MTNIIQQQQDKNYIKCKPILLATNSYPAILRSICKKAFNQPEELYGMFDCAIRTPTSKHHLYITSDLPISVGDYVYSPKYNTIVKTEKIEQNKCYFYAGIVLYSDICKKVIATTHPKLFIKCDGHCADNECLCSIPQIPQEFIKSYCDSNGSIDSVLVEMYDDKITHAMYSTPRWKVRTINNEVIIPPTKTSWSRDEVEELLAKYSRDTSIFHAEKFDNWIKQNL